MSHAAAATCAFPGCTGAARTRYRLARFSVRECTDCGLLSRDPLPDAAELAEMYEDERYHASAYFRDQYDAEAAERGPEARIQREALAALASLDGRRLLDVGAGSGRFLARAREAGFDASGVELSRTLVERAAAAFGLQVQCADFLEAELPASSFDVVTMWDFLEHTVDPAAVLARAHRLLAPGGKLLVFTIDCSSLFNRLAALGYAASGGRWSRPVELLYDRRHNYYFTRASLERLIRASAFEVARRTGYRAYLGRWLSEPAPLLARIGGEIVDAASIACGLPYRQLLWCHPRKANQTLST